MTSMPLRQCMPKMERLTLGHRKADRRRCCHRPPAEGRCDAWWRRGTGRRRCVLRPPVPPVATSGGGA
uniref:Uncharacterized protein n=1 Tax=Arundo donax TaxID=35708 RepID=A0A0A9AZF7_ARUDO